MDFYIAHEIPGRIRLRSATKFRPGFAQSLATQLDSLTGILGVRVNPRTSSVLLLYADMQSRHAACVLLLSPDSIPASAPLPRNTEVAVQRPSAGPFLRYVFLRPAMPMLLRVFSAVLAALPFLQKGLAALAKGRLNVEVLDASAIAISLLRRDFGTASLLILLLGFGEALEAWTRKKSLDRLAESLQMDIDTVWVRRGHKEIHIPVQELQDDDLVITRAGSAIAVDGVVHSGEASVNQATMTGEALGILRGPGMSVYAGTVVEDGEIFIRPTEVGGDTRLQKIVKYIEESEKLKAGIQGKAERLADAVVPFSFLLAGLVWLVTRNATRAASVLLVDYSCALRLATPLAILTAMREGTAHGVLVKGGRYLEALSATTTVVFDKTGTLTKARPRVAEVIAAAGYERREILRIAACLEEHFPHPVARAVVRQAEEEQLQHQEEHSTVEYVVAHGLASQWNGRRVLLGSRHYIHHDEGINVDCLQAVVEDRLMQGQSLLYLAIDGSLAGIIAVEDSLRPEAAGVVQALKAQGIQRIVMLTGDDARTAAAVARTLGISEYYAEVLPTDKAKIVNNLRAEGHSVLMVGDGINDSPALSAADVGVTLRDSADIAQEVAGVVLTECRLNHLLVALHMGKRTMGRIHTNFALTMGLNSLFLLGGLTGLLSPAFSALLHNGATVGVCLNAMQANLRGQTREIQGEAQ